MFAVVRTGGKQYRVSENDVIVVEKLVAEPGETVELDQVLMMDGDAGLAVGSPLVDGARVAATVLDQARADKVLVFKKRRRKNYRRMRGHRQDVTVLRVTDILAAGEKPKPAKVEAPRAAEPAAEAEAVEAAAPAEAAKAPAKKKAASATKKRAASATKKKAAGKKKSG